MDKVNDNSIKIKVNGTEMAKVVPPTKKATSEQKATKKPKKAVDGKKKVGITILIVGVATLVAGVVFLLINLLKAPLVRDADYLVQVGAWQLEKEPSVEWKFTEIGKGTLTTNSHINDYDFIWSMDDKTLKIETDWLYALNDEYDYKLNQNDKTLTLTNGESSYIFVPAEHPANKDGEKSSEES